MNQAEILDYKNIDYSRLEFYDPLKSRGGSYVATINYKDINNTSIPIYIQTPKLKVIGGVINTTKKTYIELELDSSDTSNMEFYNFLIKFDEINLRTCHQRSRNWFGVQFPLDDIDKSYDGPIKANRNRSPSIKLNLQVIRGSIITEIYTDRKQPTDSNYIDGDDHVIAIIQIDGLRFNKTKFTFDMSVSQLKVYKNEVKSILTGYHIKDDIIDPIMFSPGEENEEDEDISDADESCALDIKSINDSNIDEDTIEQQENNYNNKGNYDIIMQELPDNIEEYASSSQEFEEPIEEPIQEPIQEPIEEPIQEPIEEPMLEHVQELIEEFEEPIQEPIQELIQEHIEEPIEEHIEEHIEELIQEHIEEHIEEPIQEHNNIMGVQKDNHNNFVSDKTSKVSQYYEDYEDIDDLIPTNLSQVNFGIDNSQYQLQVDVMRDNIRSLMNKFDEYKHNYKSDYEQYKDKISESTNEYRELCHRYNVVPEF